MENQKFKFVEIFKTIFALSLGFYLIAFVITSFFEPYSSFSSALLWALGILLFSSACLSLQKKSAEKKLKIKFKDFIFYFLLSILVFFTFLILFVGLRKNVYFFSGIFAIFILIFFLKILKTN